MAGSWLKMRHDLIDAPEIRRLAKAIGVTKDDVYGKLFRLWSWFDRHSVNGVVAGEELEAVDELIGTDGFASALVSVGWLAAQDDGIVIPNWERHNSETAKERALAAVRQERTRGKPPDDDLSRSERDAPSRSCHGPTVTREEKRREELPPLPRDGFDQAAWQRLRRSWNAGPGKPWKMVNPPPPVVDRLREPDWLEAYEAGIAKLAKVAFFKTPVSLRQFCSIEDRKGRFLDRLLGGEFDDKTAARGRGDFGDAPPPPRVFAGTDAARFAATLAREKKLREESA